VRARGEIDGRRRLEPPPGAAGAQTARRSFSRWARSRRSARAAPISDAALPHSGSAAAAAAAASGNRPFKLAGGPSSLGGAGPLVEGPQQELE
jgi:hypothetical protein